MSFRFYLALLVVCVGRFGTNDAGPSFSRHGSSAVNFFGIGHCAYSGNIVCPTNKKYRTIDGSCNHQFNPYVGKSNTPYFREMPPGYVQNKYPRVNGTNGNALPTPRDITLGFFKNAPSDPPSTLFSNALAVFARFIEHDLYHTKLLATTRCCPTTPISAGNCANIKLKEDDPFFENYRITCLPKSSTVTSPNLHCQHTIMEQVNENTHYLDLSNIYGSTDTKAKELREGKDGLLKVQLDGTTILLPKLDFNDCRTPGKCFMAGDSRVNTDPLMMTMYTIWVRQHNDLAKEIKQINQKYTDEEIFQETRKIVIAIYQHIVYSEFLPLIVPGTTWTSPSPIFNVDIPKKSISNSFSLAYTTFVDTLTQGEFAGQKNGVSANIKLQFSWHNSDILWEAGGIKKLAEGMLTDKAGKYDRFVSDALYNQYLQKILGQGTDKVSWNLQQSRENGMPSYPIWSMFSGLTPVANPASSTLYPASIDVEFLPGIFGEAPATPTDITGPSIAYILKNQFEGLRDGDVYYYNRQGIIKPDRLTEIKKMKMSTVMCKYAAMEQTSDLVFKVDPPTIKCETVMADLTKVPDICQWAGTDWSEYVESPCVNGWKLLIRECLFAPTSKCTCQGNPYKREACPHGNHAQPTSLRLNVDDSIKQEFSLYFDEQGHLLEGVSGSREQVAGRILRHLFPK